MQWLLEQVGGVSWAPIAAAGFLGRLAAAPAHCVCHFEHPGIDRELLEILRAQLDRCGPERLHTTCPTVTCPSTTLAVLVSFLAGVGIGSVSLVLVARLGRSDAGSRSTGSVSSGDGAAVTPSTLRRLNH